MLSCFVRACLDRLHCVVILAGFVLAPMLVPSAGATPPTPPAQILELERGALARIQVQAGSFAVPVGVQVNEEAGELVLHWRILPAAGLERETIDEGEARVEVREPGKRGRVELRLPALREDGHYRIEVELTGRMADQPAILDHLVIYQVVDHGTQRLSTHDELRRSEQSRRREAFHDRLRQDPDAPDIRLLASATLRVPETIERDVQPAPDVPNLVVHGEGPSAALTAYIVDRTDESWQDRDPITVQGRVVYQDFEGTWRPLVNVSINLFDDDTFGDEHLATTTTDWNGDWSFSVNNDDGFLQDGRDIYYEFHLGNTRWHVRDGSGDDYVWASAVHDDLSDGAVVDFGSETGDSNPEAMQVFGFLNLGWNHIATAGGQDPGNVDARYPTSGSFFSPDDETVNIDSADNTSPDTVLHEYGHALMHRAFGGADVSPGGAHGFGDDVQDQGLAWSEGWASGFMLSLCPDRMYNWSEGTTESSGEWPACTSQNDGGREVEEFSDGGNRKGEQNEGRVAGTISDFRDARDDDNGGTEDRGRNGEVDANARSRIGLDTIYRDSMWGFVHDDFLDFWVTFGGNLAGTTRTAADDIMQYNWMSLPLDLSCVASKLTVARERDAEELLSGLRAFRDHGMKPLQAGRRWMQTYYSHSPELAMLLIEDEEAQQAALTVIRHFAMLGQAFANHRALEKLAASDQPVVPGPVRAAIERVLRTVEARGSEELKSEVEPLRMTLREFQDLTLSETLRRVAGMTPAEKGHVMQVVDPSDLSPASRKVDWRELRRRLEPSQAGGRD